MLPEDVLLEIFDICRRNHDCKPGWNSNVGWKWHILVHVCRRWRHITFSSPLRLDLRIFCTYGTPVRKHLNIWPTFPIVIGYDGDRYGRLHSLSPTDEDNVIAALEQTSRVCEVRLDVTGPQLGGIATVMQEPFLALTHLILQSGDRNAPVLPGQFLGRSAPCLQELSLHGIPFPTLAMLLPSTSDLITLTLSNIPHTGYISPETMVAGLATLTRLRQLSIGFRSPNSRPDQIRLPPTARTVFPTLTSLSFHGVREYLEGFAARIDAPQLHSITIRFLNQLVDFDVPQLSRIIDHSEALKHHMGCYVTFTRRRIHFKAFPSDIDKSDVPRPPFDITFCIVCEGIDWQVSHLTQALIQLSAIPSNMVHFTIESDFNPNRPIPEDMDDIEWQQLLSLFSSVRTLFVSDQFARHISRALEVIADRMMTTEVLPALDLLYLEGQSVSSVDKFIAARSDSGRPVTIVNTETEFSERLNSPTYMR